MIYGSKDKDGMGLWKHLGPSSELSLSLCGIEYNPLLPHNLNPAQDHSCHDELAINKPNKFPHSLSVVWPESTDGRKNSFRISEVG
jgi:hypothetical protein